MANTTQSMTRCDNVQARCPARPVSNRACSITAGEITLLRPASRSKTVSASGVGSKQLPCLAIIIASLKPGSYTHPRLQEAMTCVRRTVLFLAPCRLIAFQSGRGQPLSATQGKRVAHVRSRDDGRAQSRPARSTPGEPGRAADRQAFAAWFKRRSQLRGAWGRRPKGDAPRSEAGALGARWLSPARPQPPRSCHPRRSGS